MAFTVIEYGITYPGFGDSHRANADRHEARAQQWDAAGKPDYALVSRMKAQRNRRRYREIDLWMNGALPAIMAHSLMRAYIKAAERSLDNILERALMDGSGPKGLSIYDLVK